MLKATFLRCCASAVAVAAAGLLMAPQVTCRTPGPCGKCSCPTAAKPEPAKSVEKRRPPDNKVQGTKQVGPGRGDTFRQGTRSVGDGRPTNSSGDAGKAKAAVPDTFIQYGQAVGPGAGSNAKNNTQPPKNTGNVGPSRGTGDARITGVPVGPARGESRDRDRDEDRPRNTSTRNDNGDDRRTTRPRDRDDDTPAQRSTTPTRKAEPSPPPARSASTGAAALVTGSTGAALTGAKWSHNNSTMRFENQGETMRVLYDQPKSGLAGLGIAPGTPLFDGKKTGANSYAGEATTFSKSCGPAKFQVAGDLSGDGRRLVLRGQKPERGSNCQVSGYRPETLSFEVAR